MSGEARGKAQQGHQASTVSCSPELPIRAPRDQESARALGLAGAGCGEELSPLRSEVRIQVRLWSLLGLLAALAYPDRNATSHPLLQCRIDALYRYCTFSSRNDTHLCLRCVSASARAHQPRTQSHRCENPSCSVVSTWAAGKNSSPRCAQLPTICISIFPLFKGSQVPYKLTRVCARRSSARNTGTLRGAAARGNSQAAGGPLEGEEPAWPFRPTSGRTPSRSTSTDTQENQALGKLIKF